MVDPHRTRIRPDSWPANHRAALTVFVDIDPVEQLWAVPVAAVHRAMNERLLEMLADLYIVPTVIVDAEAEPPSLLPSGLECDLAVHRTTDSEIPELMDRCTARFGSTPTGVVALNRLPGIPQSPADFWLMDGSGGNLPLSTEHGGVIIPYSPWWHDVTWFSVTQPGPPSALLESWSASLTSVRSHGELMTIVISGQASGHPGHLEAVQRFLDEAIAAGDVWITSASAVASWTHQSISQ